MRQGGRLYKDTKRLGAIRISSHTERSYMIFDQVNYMSVASGMFGNMYVGIPILML